MDGDTESCMSYDARKERGNAHFKARQYVRATSEYSAALACAESDDQRAVALNNRALARLEMGEYEGAVEDCTGALAVDPANVKALMRRALAYTQQHEHDRAVADYTAALEHTPDHLTPIEQPAWVPLCHIRRALALESLNRLDSLATAIADLEVARTHVLPADMLRQTTDGIKRISRSIELDSELRKQHPADEGLVRSDQLLRLYFSSALPTQLCLGESLSLSVYVANELGCWRREDFQHLFLPSEMTTVSDSILSMPLAVTARPWPAREATKGSCGVRLELLGVGKNVAEAEANAATGANGNSGSADRACVRRVASLTDSGRVTLVMRLTADADATDLPAAIQLQVETSSDVQLQRGLVGVLSLPMALQMPASQRAGECPDSLAQVNTQAGAVFAEACRELVVSHKIDYEVTSEKRVSETPSLAKEGATQEWRLMAAESGAYLGIGGKLWDSSWNMAAFLVEDFCTAKAMAINNSVGNGTGSPVGGLVSGRRVLELGAGTGVLGSLCAQLGAASVTVTDLATSVPLIELNLSLNFASVPVCTSDAASAPQCEGHDSTAPVIPVAKALPWGEPLDQEVLDRIGGLPCDCLLMCDVVYEPHLFPLLLTTMSELCGPETLVLLAYRRRNPDEWQFFERLAADGFTVEPLHGATDKDSATGTGDSIKPWVPTFGSHLLRLRRLA